LGREIELKSLTIIRVHPPGFFVEDSVKPCLFTLVVTVSLFCSACGGGNSGGNGTPPPANYTIGGTVSGLSGSGLVLQNNGGNNLSVSANGPFTFTATVASGAAYAVTVLTQPTSPAQTCTVTNGSGTAPANVTTVQVACTNIVSTYTIGGTVSGLSGAGLVLQNNGGNNLSISASGPFTFTTPIASGATYTVTVLTQPSGPAQTCTVTNGSGTATTNVTTVQVTCTTSTYTIGGTVSGLSGTGLVLQDNDDNNLPISANGPFTFTTPVTSGATYAVTVLTQPSGPAQTCTVANGSGTATANVTTVQVACTTSTYTIGGTVSGLSGTGLVLQNNSGNNLPISANGAFTFTTPVASGATYSVTVLTQPSSPAQTCTVTNGTGTATANVTTVQVACTTNPVSGEWIWVGGANVINEAGTYGTKGMAAPGNIPGARDSAVTWTDPSGNIWLFGGETSASALFNDLWKWSSGEWTWISGSNTLDQTGVYGTQGKAGSTNVPGARSNAMGWTDANGNLWLFGGYGFDSAGTADNLNDLWEYNTSTAEWTWIDGFDTVDHPGIYGTLGVSGSSNIPGTRYNGTIWTDQAGNFWLFGGYGYDSISTYGPLNDLWKFSAGQWTWMSGSIYAEQPGVYGTKGKAAAANVPGARSASAAWTDASGNLWLFGGGGYDSVTTLGYLDDLWNYSAGTDEWTWIGGSNLANQGATYGTQGTASSANTPGGRFQLVSWTDAAGDFWLFGGQALDSTRVNDLWKYSSGEWTWVSGSDSINESGVYGTQGVAAASNIPGARQEQVGWTDSAGNLWLFGGLGYDSNGSPGYLNDLWEFTP
jgi:N-acetylneuraminic acid mutarotase